MSYSYGGGGYGQGPSNFPGDVGAYAAQLQHGQRFGHHPTPLQALASAVALPDVFTEAEMARTLRRNNGDVMRAALQLKEKHAFRTEMHYQDLNVGLPTLQEELRKGYVHLLDGAADSERCPVLLLQLQYFKPGFGDGQKLQRQGRGAADGSAVSSLEDARRLCVYLMDLAVELMEERNAPGIVFIVDVANCTLANLEAKMVTDILQVCKNWYPEVVKRILVINSSAFTKVLTMLLAKLLGARTQQRIRVMGDPRELNMMLPPPAIPQCYGGSYPMIHPNMWMKKQAELEDVDLDAAYNVHDEEEEEDKGYGLEEREIDPNESLNGMQYANVSAVDAAEMPNSVLRGPLMRKKMDGVWAKHFALLRPEAVLLYENATGIRPIIIIPVNYEVRVVAATFPDRPKSCGFRIEVPGIVGGHELVATSEQERGNWLQELQWAINHNKEKLERREEREERRAKIHRDFDALNMINFDVDLPVPLPIKTDFGNSAMMQQQVRSPQPVEMLGMSMPVPMTMNTMQSMQMQQPISMSMQPQAMSIGMQSQPMAGMVSMGLGMQQAMSMGLQQNAMPMQPMAYGMQQQGIGMQPGMMSMNMQPSMAMGTQQPMMGIQQQQPMQRGMQQQTMQMQQQVPMSGQQGMNMPASSGYQLNSKSLQEQLLNSFRG
ncbi:Tyrosine-protein phosphatase non-receptor type 9 [Phytophthora nicotianae]|uniref:Cationic amino acid transporter 9 n=1 Tax=Phytophthora nicotianae TaxID=4792 RepID=A0A0W8CB47_PHYNI|nr:Tyrosine-protein phosphatase non-receptor type 9 [Phytophthora nicotianae]KUF96143.1 Cationic amino acid transporter 9 [Phytophthora nicotianae]